MSWLLAATWKGSLLLALALTLHWLLRDRISPRWRHALLLVAMMRLLLPVAPAAPFSVFNLASAADDPVELSVAPRVLPVADGNWRILPVAAPAPKPSSTGLILLALWATGSLLVIGRVARHSLRLRRRLREDATGPVAPETLALLDICRDALEIRRRVRLVASNVIDAPALHGMVRPTMLVPARILETFTTEQLRFIFLHELGHLRRSDVLLNWVTTAIQALHWFNPLVWIATARLSEERELACDALALAALDRRERGAYGETVLQILDRFRAPSLAPGLIGMTATKQQMKRRIQMIATFRNESRRAAWFGVLIAALALVTLTDASAGEKKFILRDKQLLTPEAKAVVDRLDVPVTFAMDAKSLDDIVNTASNLTGVRLTFADAIDADARRADIKVKADRIPAHMLLVETLKAFDLRMDFTADGATIVKSDRGNRFDVEVPGVEGEEDRVVVLRTGDKEQEGVMKEKRVRIEGEDKPHSGLQKKIKKMHVNNNVEKSKDGAIRWQINLRGGHEGQPEGTLELEVNRAPASSAR